jgi:hypothetical protein
MKIVLILIMITFGLLVACNSMNSDNKQVTTKTEIVFTGTKNIEDTNFVAPKGLLLGKWTESIQWVKRDSIWIGMKSLNLIHEYEFFPNGELVFREIDIENSHVAWINRLRGFLNKSRNILYVVKNQRNDTIFKPGELLKKETKRIHLLNDTLLRIDEHFIISGEYKLIIVDYKRVK